MNRSESNNVQCHLEWKWKNFNLKLSVEIFEVKKVDFLKIMR